jgi:hypothetical protein
MQPWTVPPHEAEPATLASEQKVCVASQAACAVSVVGAASKDVVDGRLFQFCSAPLRVSLIATLL